MLLALLPACFPAGASNDGPLERATLRGLHSINVVIDTLDPALVHDGLAQDDMRSRIEQDIGAGEITLDKEAREFLGLRITQVRAAKGPYALCVSLGVYQPVALTRDKEVHTVTQTWEVVSVLMADPKLLAGATNETIHDLTQRFVAAWRLANPK